MLSAVYKYSFNENTVANAGGVYVGVPEIPVTTPPDTVTVTVMSFAGLLPPPKFAAGIVMVFALGVPSTYPEPPPLRYTVTVPLTRVTSNVAPEPVAQVVATLKYV